MKNKRRVILLLALLLVVIGVVCYTQITIFVVQPIGAVPEGRTLIISRLPGTKFIDSADAMCERMQGGVSLLCRGIALGRVSENASVYIRLPYSETLYLLSTDGQRYEGEPPLSGFDEP
jgi:hypothetical protein